jgi:ketosteroid isomerase-like protein
MTAPREVLLRLLDGVAAKRWDELPLLYAEDAHVTHPPHGPELNGREELRRHFAAAAEHGFDIRAEDVIVHETADPEVVIGEFRYRGTSGDQEIDAPRIFVMRIRGGLIVESRDYRVG